MTSLDRRPVSVRQRPTLQAQLGGSHPADLAETLPARCYNDPAIWQRERWPIFASNWVHIAYDHQLRNSGDYVTENLAGWPIFIRRKADGSLTAFYNLWPAPCRPAGVRGRRLLEEPGVQVSRLGVQSGRQIAQCPRLRLRRTRQHGSHRHPGGVVARHGVRVPQPGHGMIRDAVGPID